MKKTNLDNESIVIAIIKEGSIKGAAASLHCTEKTLYARMKAQEFQTLYKQLKADLIAAGTAQLQGQVAAAVSTLAEIMKDPEAAKQTRVNAATSILAYCAKYTEQADILARLDAIERAQAEMIKPY